MKVSSNVFRERNVVDAFRKRLIRYGCSDVRISKVKLDYVSFPVYIVHVFFPSENYGDIFYIDYPGMISFRRGCVWFEK